MRSQAAMAAAGCLTLAVLGLGALTLRQAQPEQPIRSEVPNPEPPLPGEGTCPAGQADSGMGPDMIRLPEGFCIDKTEVTRGQYEAWLSTNPASSGQSSSCAGNDSYTPSCAWDPGSDQEMPVVCVDWCDAQAFCAAAGKRLCGAVGTGAAYELASYDDPAVSEWHAACTSGGKFGYSYGDDFNTDTCRDADADDYTTWGIVEVGSQPDCHSPDAAYSKTFDLSGNVAEWDNSCESDDATAGCRIRGGSYQHHAHGTRCDMGRGLKWPRGRAVDAVGFRCCAD